MANISISTSNAPRFNGDFGVVAGNSASPEELAYCSASSAALDQLARDETVDMAAAYPASLLADRRGIRTSASAALKVDAQRVLADQKPAGNVVAIAEVIRDYTTRIAKFGVSSVASPRFDGEFEVITVTGYATPSDVQAFLDEATALMAELASDAAKDLADHTSDNVKEARRKMRADVAQLLSVQITSHGGDGKTAEQAKRDVLLLHGQYQARRDRLARRLFNVSFKPDEKPAGAPAAAPIAGAAVMPQEPEQSVLGIMLLGNLPPPEDKASPEKLDLYIQITKTNTVIRAVCERLRQRPRTVWAKLAARLSRWDDATPSDRARRLEHEFLEKLHGVAVIGLELNFVDVAKATLAELRNEFFALEAGRIKSAHSTGLAIVAFIGSVLLLVPYAHIDQNFADADPKTWQHWLFVHKNFLLAACGAAIGTWGSFSVRQVQFVFEDLMMLEERAIKPAMRVLFVVILTMAACLLFWTGALNLEMGGLKTNAVSFTSSGAIAVLIGLFCGLSERALATAIAGRAASFVGGIAGK